MEAEIKKDLFVDGKLNKSLDESVVPVVVDTEKKTEELLSFLYFGKKYKEAESLSMFAKACNYMLTEVRGIKFKSLKFLTATFFLILISLVSSWMSLLLISWVMIFGLFHYLYKKGIFGGISASELDSRNHVRNINHHVGRVKKFSKILGIDGCMNPKSRKGLNTNQEKQVYDFFRMSIFFEQYVKSSADLKGFNRQRITFKDKVISFSDLFDSFKALSGKEKNYNEIVERLLYLALSSIIIQFDSNEGKLPEYFEENRKFKTREDMLKSFESDFEGNKFERLKDLEG